MRSSRMVWFREIDLYQYLTGNRTMSTLIGVTEDKTEVFLRVYLI